MALGDHEYPVLVGSGPEEGLGVRGQLASASVRTRNGRQGEEAQAPGSPGGFLEGGSCLQPGRPIL